MTSYFQEMKSNNLVIQLIQFHLFWAFLQIFKAAALVKQEM